MVDVVEYSMQYLFDVDLLVMVCYLKQLFVCEGCSVQWLFGIDIIIVVLCSGDYCVVGLLVYVEYCQVCYCVDGRGMLCVYLVLVGNLIVFVDDFSLLVQVILIGGCILYILYDCMVFIMLGFEQLLNVQLVQILIFICSSWGNQVSVVSEVDVVCMCWVVCDKLVYYVLQEVV